MEETLFHTNISMEDNVQAGSWICSLFLSRERCFRHWRGDREEGENEGWPVGIYDAVQGTSAPHRHCSDSTAGGKATATSGVYLFNFTLHHFLTSSSQLTPLSKILQCRFIKKFNYKKSPNPTATGNNHHSFSCVSCLKKLCIF